MCEAAPWPPVRLLALTTLNPGPAPDPDGGARGSVGKEEVSQPLQGVGPQATQPCQLLAKGQPVEFVGLPSTPSLTFFSCSPLGPILWMVTVVPKKQPCGQGQLGSQSDRRACEAWLWILGPSALSSAGGLHAARPGLPPQPFH